MQSTTKLLAQVMFLALSAATLLASAPANAVPTRIGGRVVDRGDGSLFLTVRQTDGSPVFGQKTALSTVGPHAWDGWYWLDGVLASQPVALLNGNGKVIVFGRGTDNRMYFRQETTAGSKSFDWWNVIEQYDMSWNSVPPFTNDPALVRLGDGRLAVFGTSSDGAIYWATQTTAGGSWTRWTGLGKPLKGLNGSPVIALNGNGALSVFARGGNRALWVNKQATANGAWLGWSSLGWMLSDYDTSIDAVAAALGYNGRQIAIVNNSGGTVSANFQTSANSTSWNTWANLLGGAHGNTRPALAANQDGRFTVFFRADYEGGHQMYFQSQTAPGATTWNNWTPYGRVNSSPVTFTDVNGILHVFALDEWDNLHEGIQTAPNASTFSDWDSGYLNGPFSGL